MDTTHLLLYILGCIILIGFFAGIEIAFISVSKLNIELRKKQGTMTGKILARFMEEPEEFIGSSLIGVNITLVVYGLLMTQLTDPYLNMLPAPFNSEYVHLFLDTLIATVVILTFAEFIPKAVFRAKAEQALVIFSVPMKIAYVILSPLSKIFVAISEFILKYLFNVRIKENQKIFNRIDL
jgi:CBS domain containing-hemolysin-like protein